MIRLRNILGILERPTEGQCFPEGFDITRLPDKEQARIRQGVTIVMVTHDDSQGRRAGRRIMIRDGETLGEAA
jgi:ABC-type lipoprotein export system ATPase subunit